MKTRQTRASHGSLRAIVLGLVGLGVHAVAAQQQDEGRGPRADDVLELNVPLAGRAELKRHPEADQELLDMLSRFLRTREEPSHRRRGAELKIAEAQALVAFAGRHRGARAALTAKYLAAHAVYFLGPPPQLAASCRSALGDMARSYVGSREATLSQLLLIGFSARDRQGRGDVPGTHQAMIRLRAAFRAALPALKVIDEDKAHLAVAFRKAALDKEGPQFVPVAKVQIGLLTKAIDGDAEGNKILKEVIREYPGTEAAREAERLLRGTTLWPPPKGLLRD